MARRPYRQGSSGGRICQLLQQRSSFRMPILSAISVIRYRIIRPPFFFFEKTEGDPDPGFSFFLAMMTGIVSSFLRLDLLFDLLFTMWAENSRPEVTSLPLCLVTKPELNIQLRSRCSIVTTLIL